MHRAQCSLQQFFSLGICVTTLRRFTEGRRRHKPRTILVGQNAYVQARVNCLLRIKRGPPSTSGPPRRTDVAPFPRMVRRPVHRGASRQPRHRKTAPCGRSAKSQACSRVLACVRLRRHSAITAKQNCPFSSTVARHSPRTAFSCRRVISL